MGVKLDFFHTEGRTKLKGVWEYLDLGGRKWREAGEDCLMNSFINCTLNKIL
jgi:hypothetical protein